MRFTGTLVFLCLSAAAAAGAQTKFTATLSCAKPDQAHAVDVGDAKGHALMLMQNKCNWTKPFEVDGVQSKDDVGSGISDVRGNMSHDQGYDVTTMSNGDKIYVRNSGTSKMKGEMPESMQGKWSFTGGTGKFKGIKGGGTFTGAGKPDGSVEVTIEGEYTVAAK